MSEDSDSAIVYALRILPRAERDIETHIVRMADFAGPDIALAWHRGLLDIIATLSQNPRRQKVVSESRRFRQEVRQILYRRTPSGPAWRVLFTAVEGLDDAPTVNILHIRHGAQRAITPVEARQIEANQ